MNSAFAKLVALRASGAVKFERIVVGVIYGTQGLLTDKFSIIRGICSGAEHDVTDIQDHVEVVAGRKFWAWVNEGEDETQAREGWQMMSFAAFGVGKSVQVVGVSGVVGMARKAQNYEPIRQCFE